MAEDVTMFPDDFGRAVTAPSGPARHPAWSGPALIDAADAGRSLGAADLVVEIGATSTA